MTPKNILDKPEGILYYCARHWTKSPNSLYRMVQGGGGTNEVFRGESPPAVGGGVGLALNPSPTANFAGVKRGTSQRTIRVDQRTKLTRQRIKCPYGRPSGQTERMIYLFNPFYPLTNLLRPLTSNQTTGFPSHRWVSVVFFVSREESAKANYGYWRKDSPRAGKIRTQA